jgi:hypothetical protein
MKSKYLRILHSMGTVDEKQGKEILKSNARFVVHIDVTVNTVKF